MKNFNYLSDNMLSIYKGAVAIADIDLVQYKIVNIG